MKSTFTKYYFITKADYEDALTNGYIVFDTNVLLDVLRAGNDFAETFRKIFTHAEVKERIRLPYHVAKEFTPKYFEILYNTINELNRIKSGLENLYGSLNIHRALIPELKDSLKNDLMKVADKYSKQIDARIKEVKSEIKKNLILKMLSSVFEGKLLPSLSTDDIKNIEKEGAERYAKNIPPGYKDAKKPVNKYGDLIVWNEILKLAEIEQDKAVLFVTEDVKEDWIAEYNGEKQGLRYELKKEFGDTGNLKFVHRYEVMELISLLNKKYSIVDNSEENKAKKTYEKMKPEVQSSALSALATATALASALPSYSHAYPMADIMRVPEVLKGQWTPQTQNLTEMINRITQPFQVSDYSPIQKILAHYQPFRSMTKEEGGNNEQTSS